MTTIRILLYIFLVHYLLNATLSPCRYMMKLKYFLWASSMCHLLKMMVLPILVSLHFPMYIYLLVSFSLNLISWLIILPFTLLFYPHFRFQICGWQILTKFLYNALAILNTVFFKGYFIFFSPGELNCFMCFIYWVFEQQFPISIGGVGQYIPVSDWAAVYKLLAMWRFLTYEEI